MHISSTSNQKLEYIDRPHKGDHEVDGNQYYEYVWVFALLLRLIVLLCPYTEPPSNH
jgi:hypothetical protein